MKPPVLALGGAVLGIGVAAAVYFLVLGGGGSVVAGTPTPEPTPVFSEGKLGPRITLDDRVFNLLSPPSAPVYAKIQTVIEFETLDEHWADVFSGECAANFQTNAGPRMTANVPSNGDVPVLAATGGGSELSPCQALEAELLHEFELEIGTGRQLIEDAVTTIVSSKTPAEIATTEGKKALREEIREAVEHVIEEPEVTRVLFVNFIMQ